MERKPMQNYRGVKPANIVYVLEGNGTEESPYKNEAYVLVYEDTVDGVRLKTLGKIIELTEEERNCFN